MLMLHEIFRGYKMEWWKHKQILNQILSIEAKLYSELVKYIKKRDPYIIQTTERTFIMIGDLLKDSFSKRRMEEN